MSKTLKEAYKELVSLSNDKQLPEIEARMLLCAINHIKEMSLFYIKENEDVLDLEKYEVFKSRFLSGEPIQYILGEASFYGRDFIVNSDVLIPRMETEEVVDFAIKKSREIFGEKEIEILDLCTGSGCIGITLGKELKSLVSVVDIDEKCLRICGKNADRFDVKINQYCGDLLTPIIEKNLHFDLLVSNPPYIVNKNDIDKRTFDYEPKHALYPINEDVISLYRRIFIDLEKVMKNNALAVFEIGYDLVDELEKAVKELLPTSKYEFVKDMNGNFRILSIYIRKE